MKKSLHVGISFHLDDSFNDIWANGAVQNVIFLYMLFQQMDGVHRVSLAYLGNRKQPADGLMLDGIELEFIPMQQAIEEVDILIEMGVVLHPEHTDAVRKRGGKTVSMRVGNDFIMDIERFVHDRPAVRYFNGAQFDAIWTIPQYQYNNRSYLEIMLRAPYHVLPHIWSPFFVDKVVARLAKMDIHFGYQPARGSKRITIVEPNISVSKTSHTPILVCEAAYRENKDAIKHVYACCTYDKREHPAFHNFIGRTDLVRDNVLMVEGRYQLPDFLSRYTDILLSHQWENSLNYVYYEALYGGYPLVHNSDLLPVGYYYHKFDAFMGAHVLLDVIENHDKHMQVYQNQANDFLEKLSPTHVNNVRAYEMAMRQLFE